MLAVVTGNLGPVDILVNNAGILRRGSFVDFSEEDFDLLMAVNVKGVWLCSQAVSKQLIQRGVKGKIINMGSIMSQVGSPTSAPYCTSKGGVLQMTKGLALALAPNGINVNAIGPGVIETAMTAQNVGDPVRIKEILASIPLGRIGQPSDVAETALFLASPSSDYITGTIIYVDGGYTAR